MNQRIRRVNEAVKEVLADRLADAKDPRIGFVTVTDVRMSPDLKSAEVFFTVLPDDEETRTSTLAGLQSATPLLRRELGSRLRLRHTPDLHFTHDPVPEQGRRIEELLRETRAGESEAPEPGPGKSDPGNSDPGEPDPGESGTGQGHDDGGR